MVIAHSKQHSLGLTNVDQGEECFDVITDWTLSIPGTINHRAEVSPATSAAWISPATGCLGNSGLKKPSNAQVFSGKVIGASNLTVCSQGGK